MADVSIGTFEVTAMSQMNPGGATMPGGTPQAPTVNISLVMLNPPEGAGPASMTISGLPSATIVTFATSPLTLGKDYEVIMREVVPVR